MRCLMDACRAINEMVFAMLFVVAVGPANVRGGDGAVHPHHRRVSKLLSEAVEAIEPGWSKVSAPPAPTKLKRSFYGVLPCLSCRC